MNLDQSHEHDHIHVGNVFSATCPCRDLLDVVASKWSALAIGALLGGRMRFGELQRHLDGISPKVLTSTLRRLEDYGIVDREVFAEVPLRVEYTLTALGRDAGVPLEALRVWAESQLEHAQRTEAARALA
ncbi:transcriptional regulator [Salinibacterium sp. UTAS2018]|uniref:winged helix-turn-helix transcriptional regulator n=1 Tax=unclassified Salinibacterium TaxID=2632331 RepID=UPI0010095EE3|nr:MULTISPECIES: helix-turn-helix domain-containing protein [unclassified Salinibacterium]MBH0009991.1 helix-turn-helix transcriptional regulator [Salinibacterium sp. SWN1162]QAV71453.1 transcriptional regulator [Salinibacterium sp. UTAS2018]